MTPEALRDIGLRLRQVRQHLGFTQEEMAKRINTDAATVQRYELGKSPAKAPPLWELHNKFAVSLDWLFSGVGTMFLRQPDAGLHTPVAKDLETLVQIVRAVEVELRDGHLILTPDQKAKLIGHLYEDALGSAEPSVEASAVRRLIRLVS